ncbi:hypothetical protein DTO164E3_899 [Paecilomyces variotii]|nr:hypothetical protein DTO032I3_5271 [Paecilomyces variotii]KAJ9206658.1 hypothetical protein DTO164E3_899 [Paecilomyces variotii]KAJ9221088.1 hypothetical protein DTO169C6_6609 [Paecilomyces variotii]KAJ9244937.1 hypothetical protein DTO169E5_1318 [Paecilomyces variotii]KAJ9262595.1 hypothetical protein DTO212C5_7910 [Paecilomyces variotii]
MEVRTLARCLRSRPASSLLSKQQAGPASLYRQIGAFSSSQSRLQGIRYASTGNPSSPQSETNSNNTSSSQPAETTNATSDKSSNSSLDELNRVLSQLDIAGRNAAQTSKTFIESRKAEQSPSGRRPSITDPLALSRAVSESADAEQYRTPVRRVELKLGPELGRQVHVDPDRGVDLAAALRNLQINCAVNRVRGQANFQKFHVRRGQRIKDLRRERWRKLFKFSFQKTVEKIQKMRAQGW